MQGLSLCFWGNLVQVFGLQAGLADNTSTLGGSTKAKKANNAAMQSRASAIAEADEKDRAKADELDAELVDHAQKVNSLPELCSDPCGQ